MSTRALNRPAPSPASAADDSVSAPRIDRPAVAPATAAAPSEAPDAHLPDATGDDAEPAVTDAGNAMRTAPIGSLTSPHLLRHFYESLAHLEDGHAHDDVRILQYGDSHTASDLGTGALRRTLQQRFGDGGRGFVSIGKPWKKYTQDGIHSGMSKEFAPEKGGKAPRAKDDPHTRHATPHANDGCHGLLGVAVEADVRGAEAWTESISPASRIELAFLEQPRGGSFDVFVDGAKVTRVATRAAKLQSGFNAIDVAETAHKVLVRAVGDGDVRVFGMTLDRSTAGVTVDSLGINGAQIYTALAWNEGCFAEQLKHRAPHLVVLAYGTNESMNRTPAAEYERKLVDLLGRVARAVPNASCLLLGPPDRAAESKKDEWATAPKLQEIVLSQRRVAEAAGCAFYDQLEAMGGAGSIALWSKEPHPRAGRDRVHLTREGYAQLANAFAADLLRAYGVWRSDNGLAPTSAPPPRTLATP